MKISAVEAWEEEDCLPRPGWLPQDPPSRPIDWHRPQKQRRFSIVTYCAASDDMVQRGHGGIPLARSAALVALAEQVVASEPVAFSEEWVQRLAKDLAQFND